MKKANVEKFLGIKPVKNILCDYKISNLQQDNLELYFKINGYRKSQDRYSRLAWFLVQGVDDLISKETDLLKYNRMSEEYFCILYGDKLGKERWSSNIQKIVQYFPSRTIYWVNRGFSEEGAKIKVREHQTAAAQKSKLRDHKKCSVRCKEYWIEKGLDEDIATEMVQQVQARGLPFYIEKYGEVDGYKKYRYACNKRIKTWESKTPEERSSHYLKTLQHTYNKHGQEMQAINLFLVQNNIPADHCLYGPPKNQFYQWIPEYGFRRYDLAVFSDFTKTSLVCIMEFHGPGHINFSEYTEDMCNNTFAVKGKKLPHLGTYGNSYKNDHIKRRHIESKYKGASYYVFWNKDLTAKDLRIK